MPLVQIEKLPDSSRTWVFGSDRTLNSAESKSLLEEVDRFLSVWKAHGAPLTVGRSWREDRFLTVAVDQSTEGASGCSIDGLFRTLQGLKPKVAASLVNGGLVFYRDERGAIQSVDRDRFTALGMEGKISQDTRVFDPTVTTLGEWRARFELDTRNSWHAKLLERKQPA